LIEPEVGGGAFDIRFCEIDIAGDLTALGAAGLTGEPEAGLIGKRL
jgi:hypothetical protein